VSPRSPGTDHRQCAWSIAGAHEYVLGSGRAMHEVRSPQSPFFAVQDGDALSVQDEEVLLNRLGVIAAVRLARLHDLRAHAGVWPHHTVGLDVQVGDPAGLGKRLRSR
jgi:hypothetical protein